LNGSSGLPHPLVEQLQHKLEERERQQQERLLRQQEEEEAEELTPLPVEWCGLRRLRSLTLSDNRIGGYVPLQWSRMAALMYLRLDGNPIQGLLPQEWDPFGGRGWYRGEQDLDEDEF
jgi:hypothetical protein